MNIDDISNSLEQMASKDGVNDFQKQKLAPEIRPFIAEQKFWLTDIDALLAREMSNNKFDKIPANKLKLAASLLVKLKADEKGLYVNGKSVLQWSNDHHIENDTLFYKLNNGYFFAFVKDEKGLFIQYSSEDDKGKILFSDIETIIDDYSAAKKQVIVDYLSNIWANSVWKKWCPCLFYIDKHDNKPSSRTQLMATEEGIYIGDKKRKELKWEDYFIFTVDQEKVYLLPNKSVNSFFNKGDIEAEKLIFLYKQYYQTISMSYSFLKSSEIRKYDELEITEYIPKIKKRYASLSVEKGKDPTIRSQLFECVLYDTDKKFQKSSIFINYFCTDNRGKYELFIDHYATSQRLINGKIVGSFGHLTEMKNWYALKFPNDKMIKLSELSKPRHANIDDGTSLDIYTISRKDLRRIASSGVIDAEFVGNTAWSYNANGLIKVAQTFEQELFQSPSHLLNYYDALNAYEDNDYKKANSLIDAAISENPNNCYYQELKQEIVNYWKEQVSKALDHIKTLEEKREYEKADRELNKAISIYNDFELIVFKEDFDKRWANALYEDAKHYTDNNQLEGAYHSILAAITKNEKAEFIELKQKILSLLLPFLKEKIDRLLSEKKYSEAILRLQKAIRIFPQEADFTNLLEVAQKKEQGKNIKRNSIIIIAGLAVIVLPILFLFWGKKDSATHGQRISQYNEANYNQKDAGIAANANHNENGSSDINNTLSNHNNSSEAEVTYEESEANDIESSEEPVRDTNGHRFVDLGLPSGVCWATCNLGAHSPSDKGEHFAWGETSSKFEYTQSTYDMDLGSDELDLDYDAAASQWGGTWRTPTREEWQELVDCCTWLWNGEGYWVSGKNGESIFLPAAGYSKGSSRFKEGERGDYWTSTPLGSEKSYEFVIKSDAYSVESDNRFYGISIRPVTN